VIGHGEHRARVTLAEAAVLDQLEDVVGELEQAQAVRDGGPRPADPRRDVAEREPELVEQHRVCACLLDRGQLLARHVLDEREQQRVAVVRLAHERGHVRNARLACRAPAALAGDQLPAAGRARAHDDRLQDALRADRLREAGAGVAVEAAARLARVRVDRRDRELDQRRLPLGASDQDVEPTPETAADLRSARQAPSPP
jgi:hypothetical protein